MDHLQIIKTYYAGCNRADRALMQSVLDEEVVHYFTHHPPVRGAAVLADYWATMQPQIDGRWSLDHCIAQGDEAVIEWSLAWVPPATGKREYMRGAEWYRFRHGRISEIRAYYLNRHTPFKGKAFELQGFPYAERGYPVDGE